MNSVIKEKRPTNLKRSASSPADKGNKNVDKGNKKLKEDDNGDTCLICETIIYDDSDELTGEDAIYCEGLCNGWLHCKCAGMSNKCFARLADSNNKFLCVYCMLFEQTTLVKDLSEEINSLKAKLAPKALYQVILTIFNIWTLPMWLMALIQLLMQLAQGMVKL